MRIRKEYVNELEFNVLLYYIGTSRLSAKIIESQVENTKRKNEKAIDAMHKLKQQSLDMKEALLTGNLSKMGELLNTGWENKKKMSESYSVKSAIVFPQHTNNYNTMFGGMLLSQIDDIAAITARRHSGAQTVTASIDSMS